MKPANRTFICTVACALAFAAPVQADPHGVNVGSLTCNVASGWGFVFGSSKDLHCTFRQNDRHAVHYVGSISKFGVDIGYQQSGVLVWAVIDLCIMPGERGNNRYGPSLHRQAVDQA